ncbi:hypothetical protein [Burkholderia anthina]|uniref:hypothetical protein n=1 Tax=Burkholderia anthina TaxID=179879 RepID=UPI00158C98A7|nr:hypothetical protein [Burkholderia anthina]
MIDFAKLNDPEHRARVRQEIDEQRAKAEEHEKMLRRELAVCLEALDYDMLREDERSLVRNCRSRLNTFLQLSEKQEKWLLDIARRVRAAAATSILALIDRHAEGNKLGEHPTYPRREWPLLGEPDVDPDDYWFWVLRLVNIFGNKA